MAWAGMRQVIDSPSTERSKSTGASVAFNTTATTATVGIQKATDSRDFGPPVETMRRAPGRTKRLNWPM